MNLRAPGIALLLCTLLAADAFSMFLEPDRVPVDRLIATATRYLHQHPEEAGAHYTLARIHYLAFSQGNRLLESHGVNDRGQVSVEGDDGSEKAGKRSTITLKRRREHAVNAFYGFKRARQLEPKDAGIALGHASFLRALLEQKAKFPDLPTPLQEVDLHDVRAAFAEAMSLAAAEDTKLKELPLHGLRSLVSYEAATNLISLAAKGSFNAEEQRQVKRARQIVQRMNKLPLGMVTPIVFALEPQPTLNAHLAPEVTTEFDLRGYGFREEWPWVKPHLGFLVWDPDNTGQITSARQLFGGYTFEIFWHDGFAALRSLDDDGDAKLTGRELEGLSVWFDRNSDGKSERAEVITVQDLRVAEIATVASGTDGIHLKHSHGVTFTDGHTVPSWDWMVEPRKVGHSRRAFTHAALHQ